MKRFVEGEDRARVTLLPECLDDYSTADNPRRSARGAKADRRGFRSDTADIYGSGSAGQDPPGESSTRPDAPLACGELHGSSICTIAICPHH